MLTPDPQVLRTLLARYATARIALLEQDTAAGRRALEDVTYTLCVATSTRSVNDAILAADYVLGAARSPGDAADAVLPSLDRSLPA
ncbi:DUF5133 domain-containing protein [Streptomyces sp. NBC_00859]|uniref:DUF5133 domain-containing protein n=1 Tax=Streptomyces sp. NBC_00859 TaxID=2903682 RepID=UPI00386EC646|nr:DUF5133 domain-containing protein [Streptomyces sp. NBC_00859]